MEALADNALIHYVDAPQELAARLSHVRVVEQDDGAALKPGERVVTLSGQLRRWDGFATDGDGATTAELLVRANRLAELNALIPPAEAALAKQAEALAQMTDAIGAAQDAVRAAAAARAETEGQLRQALRAVDQAEDALTRLHRHRLQGTHHVEEFIVIETAKHTERAEVRRERMRIRHSGTSAPMVRG
jgi:chromosome segregation protein